VKPLKGSIIVMSLGVAVVADAQIPDFKNPKLSGPASLESPDYRAVIIKRLHEIYGTDENMSFVAMRSGPGDTASGVVLQRTSDSISIDMTPCLPKKTVRYFIAPFRESNVSDEKCGDTTHHRVQVIQLSR
jgi:hypothetical protein